MDVKNPEDTLKRIKDFFGIIKNDYPDSHITMLSAIAEGAELLFVKGGFSVFPNAELTAVLPFAKEKYEKDFKNELNDFEYYYDKACMKKDMSEENEQKSNEDGYEQASLYIAEHSDILLAVWDGKLLKNGIAQGGTCDIVSKIIKEKIKEYKTNIEKKNALQPVYESLGLSPYEIIKNQAEKYLKEAAEEYNKLIKIPLIIVSMYLIIK